MFQEITLVGYLGRDPEMRYTPAGTAVTNFSVATNDNYTNQQGEKIEKTTWFRISTWGKVAEVMNQYLKKGSRVLVIGRMQSDPKTGGPKLYTRTDGSAGASFEVVARTVKFLNSKAESEARGGAVDSGDAELGDQPAAQSDDIPF